MRMTDHDVLNALPVRVKAPADFPGTRRFLACRTTNGCPRPHAKRPIVGGALRENDRALAEVLAEAPLGLIWVAPDGRVLRVNRTQLALLGFRHDAMTGRPIGRFHADPGTAAAMLDRLGRKEVLHNLHTRFRCRDGAIRHVLIDADGVWWHGRLAHTRWFVRDITRRIQLQSELLHSVERERQRIGRDLHDDLGQHLHGIYYLATLLQKDLEAESPVRARAAGRLAGLVAEALERTRSLARGLQPVNPVPEGLTLALRELAETTRATYRVDCRFEHGAPVMIHRHSVATSLYRIAQEAVNNAMKHGKPTRIRIQLKAVLRRVVLVVRDNGTGFPTRADPASGMGLHLMQGRADAIGGAVRVRRHPRGGTEVLCSAPCHFAAGPPHLIV